MHEITAEFRTAGTQTGGVLRWGWSIHGTENWVGLISSSSLTWGAWAFSYFMTLHLSISLCNHNGNALFMKDVDECFDGSDWCDKIAVCTYTLGSFNCSCREWFTTNDGGKTCESEYYSRHTTIADSIVRERLIICNRGIYPTVSLFLSLNPKP